MLRVLINDIDITNLTYSDDRLEELLVVSARYVQQDITFTTTYTISVSDVTITPDPVDNEAFGNFVVLKAACLTDWSTYRQKALIAGVRARCGPTSLDVLGEHLAGFQTLLDKGPCAAYEDMKMKYQFGNPRAIRAILSPFRGNNFDPTYLSSIRTGRG